VQNQNHRTNSVQSIQVTRVNQTQSGNMVDEHGHEVLLFWEDSNRDGLVKIGSGTNEVVEFHDGAVVGLDKLASSHKQGG
jgi:hypothetical protein